MNHDSIILVYMLNCTTKIDEDNQVVQAIDKIMMARQKLILGRHLYCRGSYGEKQSTNNNDIKMN